MKRIIPFLILIALAFACNTAKYVYVGEDELAVNDSAFHQVMIPNYYLQPGDIIYISIHSTLSQTEGMFHFPGQETVTNVSEGRSGNMYLNQSVIDGEGYIRLPVIGKVFAAGTTVGELEKVIEKEARSYVEDALARVKLVSYDITFLGEFNRVGKTTFFKDKVNILDAISEAGEATYFADRRNIRILRQTEKGVATYRIDLTDKNLISSDKFYLLPNDIVYAEPLPRKIFRVNVADYTLILATVTSTIAMIALIANLK